MEIINMHKKNNNGWVLCPSKSFPGKFYYFNVVTGEAAWSLNELEAKSLKKDNNIPKTSVNFNNYPEPNSPPVDNDETFNIDTFYKPRLNCKPLINSWIPQSPMHNQALYSNYISPHTPYIPNVMWTPVPLPTQMFMPSELEVKKQMSNQITQTQELKEKILVQTTGMSLSHRFLNYYNAHKNNIYFEDSVQKAQAYNYNKIEDNHNCNNDKKCLKFTTEMQSKVASLKKSAKMGKKTLNSSVHNETKTLDSSDLRLILLAKRKNLFQDMKSRQKEGNDRNKIVNVKCAEQVQTSHKKRVSFNVSPCDNPIESPCSFTSNGIRDVELNTICTNQATSGLVNIWTMKSLSKAQMAANVWFIMVDLNILIDDFRFIDNFVRQDENCRLAIPYAVLTIIKKLSTSNRNGSKPVLSSRNILRRLMDSPRHITLLESVRSDNVSISKLILDCCFKLLERNFHVVLVTTDTELLTKGTAANIHCYMLQQIDHKHLIFRNNNNEFSILQNDNFNSTENENLFLNKPNEFQPFVVDNKPEKTETRYLIEQNIQRNYVKSLRKVVRNDLCNNTINESHNFKPIPRRLNENNHKIVDSDKSGTIKLHRKFSSEIEEGYNKLYEKPDEESFKINLNSRFNSKGTIHTPTDINAMIKKKDLRIHNDFTTEPNYRKDVSCDETYDCEEYKRENNVSSHNEFKACFDKHETTAESINMHTSKEYMDKILHEKLKKFYVKNKVMSERIKTRGEEWMCCFTQVMENLMLHILLENTTSNPVYPCTILEAAGSIAELFKGNNWTKTAVHGLSTLYNLISPNGKLKAKFNPNDLLKTIGCGMLLVESLKASIPHSQLLMESEYSLIHLLYCMEDPESDPKPLVFVNTPTVSRCEVNEDIIAPKSSYVKKPSEILAYLKKHFREWEAYGDEFIEDDLQKQNNCYSINVVRTVGRHLNLLKINHANELILSPDPECDIELTEKKYTSENESPGDTVLKSSNAFNKTVSNKENQKKCETVSNFDRLLKQDVSFAKTTCTTTCPSEVKNVEIVKYFAHELTDEPLGNSARLLSEHKKINKTSSLRKGFNLDSKLRNIPDGISETFTDVAYRTEINRSDTANDKMAVNVKATTPDVSNDDSGLGNDNCPEHAMVKSFLIELSSSLNIIYKFVNESVLEIKGLSFEEDNKRALHEKTDKTYKFLLVILDKLKRIIEREPDGDDATVKSLLIKAGVDVANDKRVSRYKQVVTKCLEQANLLKHGLKILLHVTNENLDSQSLTSESDQTNVCYFNIFE